MKRETDLEMEVLRLRRENRVLKEESKRMRGMLKLREEAEKRHPLTLLGEWREDESEDNFSPD